MTMFLRGRPISLGVDLNRYTLWFLAKAQRVTGRDEKRDWAYVCCSEGRTFFEEPDVDDWVRRSHIVFTQIIRPLRNWNTVRAGSRNQQTYFSLSPISPCISCPLGFLSSRLISRWIAPSCWPWWCLTRPTWPAASSPRFSPRPASPSPSRTWTSRPSSPSTPRWSASRRECRRAPRSPCSPPRTPTTSSTRLSGTKSTFQHKTLTYILDIQIVVEQCGFFKADADIWRASCLYCISITGTV